MKCDIFYDTSKLSHSEQEALLKKAHFICENWWFDKLDCSISFAREQVKNISFEEAMEHFVEGALMNVIERNQILLDKPCLEVGFRSMESPVDYFLWIIVPLENADDIVKGMVKEKSDDGINESVPDVILNDVLIEDLEFQPDFDGDKEQCRKKENSRNLGKCSK
ncbi:MAG TPA: hypothetical protein PLG63_10075 [bacterium]|jgi:hypothetical protein|nr:hypothetical protein [bacterium]MDX9804277.1 hypothetical protein [bacterium]HPG36668.1 hypothetical protein [bacterium]HPM45916.1 hypothetical protein [bacterium]HPV22201.1 hypothetical protein [bacterium]